jgi:hypothetical protein
LSTSSVYLLDANVLISAARLYYAFDIVPGFWNALVQQANYGKIISIDRVCDEINRGDDELVTWINQQFNSFVSTDDPEVLGKYREMMIWAYNQPQFTDAAKDEFARADYADPWIVAYAATYNCVVVTLEELKSDIRRKIPIPNVCRAFGVNSINTFQMLRSLEMRLG